MLLLSSNKSFSASSVLLDTFANTYAKKAEIEIIIIKDSRIILYFVFVYANITKKLSQTKIHESFFQKIMAFIFRCIVFP